jgi:hypothetical protein
VHEHEGVRYFNKESFEQLIWWSTLPTLLGFISTGRAQSLTTIEAEIRERFRLAAAGGYRVEALLDAGPQTQGEKLTTRDTKVH